MNFAHLTLKKSLKVKSNDTIGKNNPDFLFTANSNWEDNCNILRVISILKCRNYEFANFTLKNSLKVKSNDTVGKSNPDFLFTVIRFDLQWFFQGEMNKIHNFGTLKCL